MGDLATPNVTFEFEELEPRVAFDASANDHTYTMCCQTGMTGMGGGGGGILYIW